MTRRLSLETWGTDSTTGLSRFRAVRKSSKLVMIELNRIANFDNFAPSLNEIRKYF